ADLIEFHAELSARLIALAAEETSDLMAFQMPEKIARIAPRALETIFLAAARPVPISLGMIFSAPLTTALIASQTPEKICLMPFQAPFQSPLITDVTVLMIPPTTLSAALTTLTTVLKTVVTTGASRFTSHETSGAIAFTKPSSAGI